MKVHKGISTLQYIAPTARHELTSERCLKEHEDPSKRSKIHMLNCRPTEPSKVFHRVEKLKTNRRKIRKIQ